MKRKRYKLQKRMKLTTRILLKAASDIAYGGLSINRAAAKYGISTMQIRYHILGRQTSGESRWFQIYKNNIPLEDIQKAILKRTTAAQKPKAKRTIQKERAAKILLLHKSGMRQADIARKLSISESTVSRTVRGLIHPEIKRVIARILK